MYADIFPDAEWQVLFTFASIFIRFFVALVFFPALGVRALPIAVVGGFSLALAAFFLPGTIEAAGVVVPVAWPTGLFLLATEFGYGLLIGLSLRMCWTALCIAGGLQNNVIFLDMPTAPLSLYGSLTFYLATCVFFVTDGHHLLIQALHHHLMMLPPMGGADGAFIDETLLYRMLRLLSAAFMFGILVSAPLFVTAILVETVMGVLWRLVGSGSNALIPILRVYLIQLVLVLFLWQIISILVRYLSESVIDIV
ncbi:MAG: flagellar biosynthetic protein FliR [Deltaproteobacteria bacterium]|nr:flagellar biosynthetic protein FliR [Deltaproteobacteria bacterium]